MRKVLELLTLVDGVGCDTQRSKPGRRLGGRTPGRRSVEVTKTASRDVCVCVLMLVASASAKGNPLNEGAVMVRTYVF